MKRTVLTAALSGALALLWACNSTNDIVTNGTTPSTTIVGSGRVVTEARPVQGFTAVSVSGGVNLIIEQTGVESLAITAEDNILEPAVPRGPRRRVERLGRLFRQPRRPLVAEQKDDET